MQKNKVLFIASVASMIDQFNMHNITILQRMGYDVHVVANFSLGNTSSNERIEWFKDILRKKNVIFYDVQFFRGIGTIIKNYQVYKKIREILSVNEYRLIHLHSPIGGAIGRLAARKLRNNGVKVIYTAHGFHFFKGSSFVNWLIFYPIEYLLSTITDVIITINKEDYDRAKKFNTSNVVYIPGIGVDTLKYNSLFINRDNKRKELGIPLDYFVILSVGELSKRKNHQVILRAIQMIREKKIAYIICGRGKEENALLSLSRELGDNKLFKLLGYRTDINEIMTIADCFAFPSKREGLGIASIEAMAMGLPLVTSNVNGINDYSVFGETGFAYSPNDVEGFMNGIVELINNEGLRKEFSEYNKVKAKEFDCSKTDEIMLNLYREVLG
jgi:glycosyltransferase involved in cell wall biosynthesis